MQLIGKEIDQTSLSATAWSKAEEYGSLLPFFSGVALVFGFFFGSFNCVLMALELVLQFDDPFLELFA